MSESQRLKHGKALCGKAFSRFVETFNELVDFKDNLKGDADLPTTHNGIVKVDRSDPAHPVVRTDLKELYREIDARVNKPNPDRTCFRLETRTELELGIKEEGEEGADDEWVSIVDCYANIGGVTHCYRPKALWKVDDEDEEEDSLDVMYLEVDDSGGGSEDGMEDANVKLCPLGEFLHEQKDTAKYLTPLYVMKGKKVVTDLRCAPQIQLVEILKSST